MLNPLHRNFRHDLLIGYGRDEYVNAPSRFIRSEVSVNTVLGIIRTTFSFIFLNCLLSCFCPPLLEPDAVARQAELSRINLYRHGWRM